MKKEIVFGKLYNKFADKAERIIVNLREDDHYPWIWDKGHGWNLPSPSCKAKVFDYLWDKVNKELWVWFDEKEYIKDLKK